MKCKGETWRPRSGAASAKVATIPALMADGGAPAMRIGPQQTHRHACAYGGRYGEDADGEVDHTRQNHDVLARDGEDVNYSRALKRFLQFLGHERAIPEYHPSHDGRLARPEAVSERHVGTAVYLADPTSLLPHRLYAPRLDERADPLRREVSAVIEAVLTDLGA